MSFSRDSAVTYSSNPFLWNFLRSNIRLLLFLTLAGSGMMAVHWYFTPQTPQDAAAVAAAGDEELLTAPIFKAAPNRPVLQRFAQSPAPVRVGIIVGHRGHDTGAVCEDGLTEAQVNENVAAQVVARLQERRVFADLLEEYDPLLNAYSGVALISIHADSCDYVNDEATGFKVSGSPYTDSAALTRCVQQEYARSTGLPYHANTITPDMTDYHAFRETVQSVPAVIIETGFMNLDRELLTTRSDIPAAGISNGILCFLEATGYLEGVK